MSQEGVDFLQDVQGGHFRQIDLGVGLQHPVVEPLDIEAHDQVQLL